MDGTLIGKDLQIPPRTREAVAKARARGVRFVIATGRMFQSALPYARELELEGMPMIAYNGALIKEYPSGQTMLHEPMAPETGRTLAAFCEASGYHLQAYVDDKLYVSSMDRLTEQYLSVARVEAYPVGSIFLWLREPSTKMLVVDTPERIPRIQAEVRNLLGPAAHVVSSYPTFLEITSSTVSKGGALEKVAGWLGIERGEVAAIGDAMNDISMFSWADTSFAFPHSTEAVKRAATQVTQGGPGDGVAEALEKMGLLGD